MIDIEDLWVGDTLRLIKSGRIGKFEGIKKDGKIKVNIGNKIIVTTLSNLETYTVPDRDIVKEFTEKHLSKTYQSPKSNLKKTVIDLHIEVLDPHLKNQRVERILQVQIEAAKSFIEHAISKNYSSVEIIHGRGQGVLKSEVAHLLSLYKEVKIYIPTNEGGATEVLFY
ncbi:MAG: Smr/MutS family protein [Saprospiraceae bacterium]